MRYNQVYLEDIAWVAPQNVISTRALEMKLKPALDALGIPVGHLEALTGLKERRFWDPGMKPSVPGTEASRILLGRNADFSSKIGALVNGSVCRDYLEPATATVLAHELGLPQNTVLFDVSNACLGFATAMSVVANMIELNQVEAALVVSSEGSLEVVENTISNLLSNPSEKALLAAVPTLTLGSAAVAMLMVNKRLSKKKLQFVGGVSLNDARQSQLCIWGPDTGFPSSIQHTMATDGKTLLETGTVLAAKTWDKFSLETGFDKKSAHAYFCHQVGPIHTSMVFKTLGLDASKDYSSYEVHGNTGSAALPLTLGMGIEADAIQPGQKAVLMGIGSGLVCTMYALEWHV